MGTNVQVNKGKKDNNANLIKKFTRKVQESGVITRVKKNRYAERAMSAYVKKTKRLKSINRKSEIEEQIKLGKMVARTSRK